MFEMNPVSSPQQEGDFRRSTRGAEKGCLGHICLLCHTDVHLCTQQVFIDQVLVLVGGVASLSEDKGEALLGLGEALGWGVAHPSSTLLLLQEFLVDREDKVLPTLGAEHCTH